MAIFVIQEHNAKKARLHWDFRLEINGVMKSWAIPKIPPTEPNVKRLAIQTEDHGLSFAGFEGEIAEGYGAGTVRIWDKGTFSLEEKGEKKLVFTLHGKRLNGRYCLVGLKKNWLFFKIAQQGRAGCARV